MISIPKQPKELPVSYLIQSLLSNRWKRKPCTISSGDSNGVSRSISLFERFFREFRAKADEIGAFPNETSCLTVFHLGLVRERAKLSLTVLDCAGHSRSCTPPIVASCGPLIVGWM